MSTMNMLIKRNIKLFLRDRATVFFSFLSTLIIIALYFLFIGKMYRGSEGGEMSALSGGAQDFIIYLQMMAGVLVLNSMSLVTGAFATIARDFESKRIESFMLAPVKVSELIISYVFTGFISSFVINAFTWMLSYLIIGITTGYWLAIGTFFTALLILLVASLISCAIMFLITALVKSSSAIGVINGISGTFFGFLCGIYVPYSSLGDGTKAIGSLLPFSHLTIWLKRLVLENAFLQVGIPTEIQEVMYNDFFSAGNIGFLNMAVPLGVMVGFSLLFGVLCFGISCMSFNRRMKVR